MKLVVVAVPGIGQPSIGVPAAAEETAIDAAGALVVLPGADAGEGPVPADVHAPTATAEASATAATEAWCLVGSARIAMADEE
jgi:hypothetical protein